MQEEIKGMANELLAAKVEKELLDELDKFLERERTITLPDGYQFVDENGNVINASKNVLEKKKPKYPTTYEERCKVLGIDVENYLSIRNIHCYDGEEEPSKHEYELLEKMDNLWSLLICRDAYWKIAGDWKYDVNKTEEYFYIVNKCGRVVKEHYMNFNHILAFPTEEMRDAFYEAFKDLIEECKEFL